MGSVLQAVQAMGDPGNRCFELVQCMAFLPGWVDKNFQVRLGWLQAWTPGVACWRAAASLCPPARGAQGSGSSTRTSIRGCRALLVEQSSLPALSPSPHPSATPHTGAEQGV